MVKGWESEARVFKGMGMNAINQGHIVRFITAFGTAKRVRKTTISFLSVPTENLRSLRKTLTRPSLTDGLVKAKVKQLLGLADALCVAHYPETSPSFRHGHLKPENILWFKGDEIGKLKIGYWRGFPSSTTSSLSCAPKKPAPKMEPGGKSRRRR